MRLPVYLDYAATTPVDPRVAQSMCACLTLDGTFGNPASQAHAYGWAAEAAVEEARRQVASLVGAEPREIVWTSGATESDNLAIKGAARASASRGRHLVTLKSEHRAVLDSCRQLQREGFEVAYLDPQPDGRLDLDRLAEALRPDTTLVSVMHANNEIGVVQDISAIAALTRARGVLLHVDAAQSAGKIPIDLGAMAVDLMSFSAHKVYGPKGIGALYVGRSPPVAVEALMHGGGQERGLRPGTLPTHQIVGMGEAFRLARLEMDSESARLLGLRRRLWRGLEDLGGIFLNGDGERCLPGLLNLSFAGVEGEALILALRDLAVSAGSACASGSLEPSHVLRAIGLEDGRARGAVRFSLGRFTAEEEVDYAIACLGTQVRRLRGLGSCRSD